MKTWIFSVEITEHIAAFLFINKELEEKRLFVLDGKSKENNINELISFLSSDVNWLVGFKSNEYDSILCNYVLSEKAMFKSLGLYSSLDIMCKLSDKIRKNINDDKKLWEDESIKRYTHSSAYRLLDLSAMMNFTKNNVSLQQVAISLKYDCIKESHNGKANSIINLLTHNVNIIKLLAESQSKEINARIYLSNKYNTSIVNKSRSGITDRLAINGWGNLTSQKYGNFSHLKTTCDKIVLKDIISSDIDFKTFELNQLLERLKTKIISPGSEISESITYEGSRYSLALGGIHDNNNPSIRRESEHLKLIDMDINQYYISLYLNLEAFPSHLDKRFLEVIKPLAEDRIKYLKENNKPVSDILKQVLVAFVGKLNYKQGWMYDPMQFYRITINGQLMILMLIEALEMRGIHVYGVNTDGITCEVPATSENVYYKVCNSWAKKFSLSMKFDEYSKHVVKDNENYLAIRTDNTVKTGGVFSEPSITRLFNKPIIAKALSFYFTNKGDIRKFITNHTDIMDFCCTYGIGKDFNVESHKLKNGKLVVVKTQKANRFYISVTGVKLHKRKQGTSRVYDLSPNQQITILNSPDAKRNPINYNYYISIVQNIIDTVEPKQLELF